MITITEQEFLEYTGINLSIELHDYDDGGNKVDRAIKLWTRRVYLEARNASGKPLLKSEHLSDKQVKAIKDAICEYGEYYLENGDLYRLSGFDEEKGQLISASEKEKIRFPQVCIDILRTAGLLRRNLGTKRKYSQTHDWSI